MDHSGQLDIHRVEPHRHIILPGLRVHPQSPRKHRLLKLNQHLLVLILIRLEYLSPIDILPTHSILGVRHLQTRHPGRMVAATLNHDPRPYFRSVHADLDPLAELADGRSPGLVGVGYFVVESVVGCGGGGEYHLGAQGDSVGLLFLYFVFGHVLELLLRF